MKLIMLYITVQTTCTSLTKELHTVVQLAKKFPAFVEPESSSLCSQKLPLKFLNPVQTLRPYLLKTYFHVIFRLKLREMSWDIPARIEYAFLSLPMRTICPDHLILLNKNSIWKIVIIINVTIMQCSPSPVNPSFLDPNIPSSTLSPNTLRLCS
jgi:hypothetical protein